MRRFSTDAMEKCGSARRRPGAATVKRFSASPCRRSSAVEQADRDRGLRQLGVDERRRVRAVITYLRA